MSTASPRDIIARPEKVAGAIRGLERLKADFKMAGANATTIERAIDMLRPLTAAGYRVVREGELDAATVERCARVADDAPAQTAGDRRRANAIAASIRALVGEAK